MDIGVLLVGGSSPQCGFLEGTPGPSSIREILTVAQSRFASNLATTKLNHSK